MTIKTRAFSPIEMLHTNEEIAEWLIDAYKDEEPAVFVAVLATVVHYQGAYTKASAKFTTMLDRL